MVIYDLNIFENTDDRFLYECINMGGESEWWGVSKG